MSLLSTAAGNLARQTARQQTLPALRSSAVSMQKRTRADASLPQASQSGAHFKSPFNRGGQKEHKDTTAIPNWGKYKKGGETSNKVFQYFMVGAFGGLSALGAKDTVQSMSNYVSGGEEA